MLDTLDVSTLLILIGVMVISGVFLILHLIGFANFENPSLILIGFVASIRFLSLYLKKIDNRLEKEIKTMRSDQY